MKEFKIHTVFGGFPGRTKHWDLGWGAVYLIQTANRNILVDCGGPAVTIHFEKRLKGFGLTFEDIHMVLITHFHWDHVYNLKLFPQAKLVFSKTEEDHTRTGDDLLSFEPVLDILEKRQCQRITRDGEEVFPGIRAVFTPGHTPGSLSYRVENKGETWVFTGDAIKNRRDAADELLGNDAENLTAAKSIIKIKKVAQFIAPGHDGIMNLKKQKIEETQVTLCMPKGLVLNGRQESALHIGDIEQS